MIRRRSKERALRLAALVAGDFLIGWGALAASVELRRNVEIAFTKALLPEEKFELDPEMIVLYGLSLLVALALSGFYHDRVTPRTRPSLLAAIVIQAALTTIGGTALVRPLPRTIVLAVPLLEILALPLWRRLLRLLAPIRGRETMLVGEPREVDAALAALHAAVDRRIRVDGSCRPADLEREDVRARLRDAEEVICVSPAASPNLRFELLRIRGPRGFLMIASQADALLASRRPGWIGDQPLVEIAVPCGYGVSAVVKRAIDIAGSLALLLITAPLWIVAALAIRLGDRGPILIRQRRVGLRGCTYLMWKFRSMHGPADAEVPENGDGLTGDRLTGAGSLLRRYHIDELPQLLNVLTGTMSLVGPRPERPDLAERIQRDVPDFDLRSLVRPGIAGLAQVSAEYDTRPEVKLRYDLMYMCDWSVWLDLRLMLRAVSSSLAATGR